jgi:hypothetical protein
MKAEASPLSGIYGLSRDFPEARGNLFEQDVL